MRLSQRFRNTHTSDDDDGLLDGAQDDDRYDTYPEFQYEAPDDGSDQSLSSRKQKRERRREEKAQKAEEKKRRKEEKAATAAEEAYQMSGNGSGALTRRARTARYLGRLVPARLSRRTPPEPEPLTDEEIVSRMMGSETGVMDGDLSTSDGLEELLRRESGMGPGGTPSEKPNRWRNRSAQGPIDEAGDAAQKTEAMPVTFDTPASTWVQKAVAGLMMAGLGSLVILVGVIAFQLLTAGSGAGAQGSSSANSAGLASATPLSPTQPAGRAAELAEGFANAYMAYPGTDQEAAEEYVASLEPYLHPDADKDLFVPIPGEYSQPTEVRYASATSVNEAAGEARYKVLVDARIQQLPAAGGGDGKDGGGQEPINETLAVYVKVPLNGSDAYVVAPPTTTETAPGPGAGPPGIYGYAEAQPLDEGPLKNTLQDFFEAAYSEKQSRPLVKEEMVEDASVPSFPPENRAYAGIQRSAIYYRDDLQAAQEKGFQELYDVEVYVEVLDQDSGRTTLDAWSMTAGHLEEGGYKIVNVN